MLVLCGLAGENGEFKHLFLFIIQFYFFSSVPQSERWVLHSTMEYARGVIAQIGLQKPSSSTLAKVAEELFEEFQRTGLTISKPFFKKAHRWLVSKLKSSF